MWLNYYSPSFAARMGPGLAVAAMTSQAFAPAPAPELQSAAGSAYRLRLACTQEELRAVQELRFQVFNLELNEGLGESFLTGRDEDPFDHYCDHLYVEEVATGRPVGTYRLQTGSIAGLHLGYYSEQEFDFGPFEGRRAEIVELGRACVHGEHRSLAVLNLLWRGLIVYASRRGGRYLIGCSSIPTIDPAAGSALYRALARTHSAPVEWQTTPTAAYAFPILEDVAAAPPLPRLLRGYFAAGARICGPPALDRAFGVIDFLTVLDLERLPAAYRAHFGRGEETLLPTLQGRLTE